MSHMNVSLPDELKAFVDKQVATHGFESVSEYLRDLIRKQRDTEQLRQVMLDGAASPVVGSLDQEYFEGLREQVRARNR